MARDGNGKDEREKADLPLPLPRPSPSPSSPPPRLVVAGEARVPLAIWPPRTSALTHHVPGVASAMGAVAGRGGRGDGHLALADISTDAGAGRLMAIRRQRVPTFLGRCVIASGPLRYRIGLA